MNLKMHDLRACLEAAGFRDVKTVLASGNVIFTTQATSESATERAVEQVIKRDLGKVFYTIVRSVDHLRTLVEANPFAAFRTPKDAKRVVTFLREPHTSKLSLPIELDGARILATRGREVFTVYTPSPRGPVFMSLIERTFGENVTTRTWDTVLKCVAAA